VAIDGIVPPAVTLARDLGAGEVDVVLDPGPVAGDSEVVAGLAAEGARVAVLVKAVRVDHPLDCNGIGMVVAEDLAVKSRRAIRCLRSKWCFSPNPRVSPPWLAKSS